MTRILTSRDLADVLTLDDCISAVEDAFRALGEGRIARPQTLGVHAAEGTFHVKTVLGELFALKLNANFPGNPQRHHLPTVQGVIVLIDITTGEPLAVLDSGFITTLRTAAATAVAVKHLARRDAAVATIAGCGVQGRASLEALARVRNITSAWSWDASAEAASRFAEEMTSRLGIDVRSAPSLDVAVGSSDVVITCTSASRPILKRYHLHPGIFIAGVGADNPAKSELAPDLMAGAKVVVDVLEQASTMGDLHHAIEAGAMTAAQVHGELAEIICGKVPGRTSDDEIFVFDSTGAALQDLAASRIALSRAVERGVGLEIDFAQPPATL